MTISAIGSSNSYLSVIGDSWLAQTNRIYQLATGRLPYDSKYNNIIDGAVSFTPGANPSTITIQTLFKQSQDIQTAVNAMDSAYKGLEQVQTRIEIISDVATVIGENPDLTESQLQNLNNQINYALEEIYEISKTQSYDNTPLLDGMIQTEGYYLNIAGNKSIDITDAFNSVAPENLGLPRQGEAYVTSTNLSDLYDSLSNAYNSIEAQKNRIVGYQDHLSTAFEDLRTTILSASSSLGEFSMVSLLTTPTTPRNINNDLFLTMSNIGNNILINNSDYESIIKLLYS